MCFSIGIWKIASSRKLRQWWAMGMHLLPNLVGLDNMWQALKLWASHDQKPITRKGFTLLWELRKTSGTVCPCFSLTIGEGSLTFSPFLAWEKNRILISNSFPPSPSPAFPHSSFGALIHYIWKHHLHIFGVDVWTTPYWVKASTNAKGLHLAPSSDPEIQLISQIWSDKWEGNNITRRSTSSFTAYEGFQSPFICLG